ncbi:two-component sensor histidine kinase [Arthrobacter sp. StoSoilA2]|uniref:sensor histidine kinase n=2 Tax=Arthrobacter TaxID=1663 RepID=UPI001CC3D7DD|nr:HAMP domain-containing sensor histidine kinase [Arthrobacter sp. StoSoilA2]BCW34458.1 two-component sensor histidine kinase [Arthrobacter sp. StoSoilA2]BCW52208.1 two-component sensor histidine kinase [Arthrobacter sp. StoSoilB13]
MQDTSVFMPLDDFFDRIGRRRAVVLCQLPVTLAMGLIVVFAILFSPETMTDTAFQLMLVVHLLMLVACLAVPWNRLPPGTFVLIPLVDFVVLALTREVGGPVLSVVTLLIAFPVIWLSLSASRTRLVLAIAGPFCGIIASPYVLGHEVEQTELIRMIVVPVILAGFAVTAHLVAGVVVKHRNMQDLKDRELVRLHKATQDHQQLLDAVLETVNVGVWAIDAGGNDILTNHRLRADRKAAQRMPGHNPFTATDDTTQLPDSPVGLAMSGRSFTNKLIRVGQEDEQLVFSVAARQFHDDDGQLKGSVLAFTDVTTLVSALEAKDKFVATVSHELRTPLTSMLGFLELLGNDPNPGYLQVIERNAQRLLTLINDLLLVASEDLEIRRRPANLSRLMDAAARSAQQEASAKGIIIHDNIDADLEAEVDPGQFTRAIEQLLSNAIKFSPHGSEVTVSLRRQNGGFICSISDQGIGMTAEEQRQAFTKFFRSDQAMKTAIPGAGLGLSISKAIVEAHGGQINLESRPGKGTTVTLNVSH